MAAAMQPARADAAPGPLRFYGRYEFTWSGIALGVLVLGIEEKSDSYSMHLLVASAGIVNLFTRHASDTVAYGKRDGGSYLPQYYESYYKTKSKPRHVKLAFDAKGAVTSEINEPPEDRNDRPEAPHKLKDGAYDPLTALLALRAGAKDMRVFDAKRLYEVNAREAYTEKLFITRKWRSVVSSVLSRTPLAGLTAKEKREYQQGEPPLTLYFSNDRKRIPIAVSMPLSFGYIKGTLTKECKDWNECKIVADVKQGSPYK
jgi:hypothetical protein